MKTTITIISLPAVLIGLTLLAQEPARPAAGRDLADRFRQLDRNNDGKVSAEKFPGPLFTQMDKDGDGFVTLEKPNVRKVGYKNAWETITALCSNSDLPCIGNLSIHHPGG